MAVSTLIAKPLDDSSEASKSLRLNLDILIPKAL